MLQKNSSKIPVSKNKNTEIFPVKLLYLSPWKQFMAENGYGKIAQQLNLQVLYKDEDIKNIWQELTPNESVFDLWETRNAFYQAYKFSPYFPILYKQKGQAKEIIGALPLWKNSDKEISSDDASASDASKYVWFGSNWPEDNKFFVKDGETIPLLLLATPSPLYLSEIKIREEYQFMEKFPKFTKTSEKKYFLDLTRFKTIDDFLKKLKKKKRYNLRRDRKRINALKPKIVYNEPAHLEYLFNLNIKRFRELFPDEPNEHSAFEDERRKNVFRNLLSFAGNYQTKIITTIISGKIEAVEFGLVYNKTYYALNAGADISSYSGLGVFSNLLILEDALNLGCKKIDFLEGDNNWKESWNLDHVYQYEFRK